MSCRASIHLALTGFYRSAIAVLRSAVEGIVVGCCLRPQAHRRRVSITHGRRRLGQLRLQCHERTTVGPSSSIGGATEFRLRTWNCGAAATVRCTGRAWWRCGPRSSSTRRFGRLGRGPTRETCRTDRSALHEFHDRLRGGTPHSVDARIPPHQTPPGCTSRVICADRRTSACHSCVNAVTRPRWGTHSETGR